MANMNNKKINKLKKLDEVKEDIVIDASVNPISAFYAMAKREGCSVYTGNGLYHGKRGKTYNLGK